jgi:hypothetical protein
MGKRELCMFSVESQTKKEGVPEASPTALWIGWTGHCRSPKGGVGELRGLDTQKTSSNLAAQVSGMLQNGQRFERRRLLGPSQTFQTNISKGDSWKFAFLDNPKKLSKLLSYHSTSFVKKSTFSLHWHACVFQKRKRFGASSLVIHLFKDTPPHANICCIPSL